MQRLMGHLVFVSLVKRESLSVFSSVYSFIQKNLHRSVELWASVRRELELWDYHSPLLWKDLRAPWADCLVATDASEWGLGAVIADAPSDLVAQIGRVRERWR